MDELTWGIKKRSPRTKLRALPGLVVGNLKWNQQRILRGGTRRQGEREQPTEANAAISSAIRRWGLTWIWLGAVPVDLESSDSTEHGGDS